MSRPLSPEEKCTEYSVSSEDYFRCLKSSGIQLFGVNGIYTRITPKQAMNRAVILILVLLFLHYTKIITLPFKFIPQMK
jgi:hypothetical protein